MNYFFLIRLLAAFIAFGFVTPTISHARPQLTEKLNYSEHSLQNPQDPDFATYWGDMLNLVDWQGNRGVTIYRRYFFNADGRRLFITMLNAPGVCGIRECPVRVFTEMQKQVMDVSACTQVDFHELTPDQLSFVACGIKHAIPQAGPRGSFETSDVRQFSHNGSAVRVSFYKSGALRMEYEELRKGMPASMNGAVLFQGSIDKRGSIVGTAYTFKSGCNPAPYAVQGQLQRKGELVLTGDAPVRDASSCSILGFSGRSPNARLAFSDIGWEH